MHPLNSILVEGRVIGKPEKRETVYGNTVCNFKIVYSRFYQQDETTEEGKSIFDIESWAKLAESCVKNCTEGRGVRVVGRLKQYEDGSIKIVADHVEFKPQYAACGTTD